MLFLHEDALNSHYHLSWDAVVHIYWVCFQAGFFHLEFTKASNLLPHWSIASSSQSCRCSSLPMQQWNPIFQCGHLSLILHGPPCKVDLLTGWLTLLPPTLRKKPFSLHCFFSFMLPIHSIIHYFIYSQSAPTVITREINSIAMMAWQWTMFCTKATLLPLLLVSFSFSRA